MPLDGTKDEHFSCLHSSCQLGLSHMRQLSFNKFWLLTTRLCDKDLFFRSLISKLIYLSSWNITDFLFDIAWKNVCGKKLLPSRLRDFLTNLSTKIEIGSSGHIYTNSWRYEYQFSQWTHKELWIKCLSTNIFWFVHWWNEVMNISINVLKKCLKQS